MKKVSKFSLLLLLTTFFLIFYSVQVFGATNLTMPSDKEYKDNVESMSCGGTKVSTMTSALRKDYGKKMKEFSDSGFTDGSFIGKVTIKVKPQEVSGGSLTTLDEKKVETPIAKISDEFYNVLDLATADSELAEITFKIGSTDYSVKVPTFNKYVSDGSGGYVKKNRADAGQWDKWCQAENCKHMLKALQDAVNIGIVGGGTGIGYNVASPYTTSQKPLSDLMELVNSSSVVPEDNNEDDEEEENNNSSGIWHYDFKSLSNVKFAFSAFYSPIFGKIDAKDCPKTDEEWAAYADAHPGYINGYTVEVNSEFISFRRQLQAGQGGLFISEQKKVENGVRKLSVEGSENPQSVLSYNVTLFAPYSFSMQGNMGKMITTAMKPIDGYTFCMYDNNIYKNEDMVMPIAGMAECGVTRDSLYLYYQEVESTDDDGNTVYTKMGIVIVGIFEECIVDETEGSKHAGGESSDVVTTMKDGIKHLYLTGRKIGFDGGYSDTINFNDANPSVMYANGGNTGKKGILPKKFAFPMPTKDLEIQNVYSAISGDVALAHPELAEKVKEMIKAKTDDEMAAYVFNINNHSDLPESPKGVFLFTGFGSFFKKDLTEEEIAAIEAGTAEENNDGVYYTFYILRNNKFVADDDELINWLRSNQAKAMSQVKTEELLAKIEGDFTKDLEVLQYADWLRMKEIEREIQNDKDHRLINILNVASMCFGVALIVLAVLFMMCYWVDIFNTFTEVSILNLVSFGNLYPVADENEMAFARNRHGETRYVTFKDVFILALIMIAAGILFINVSYVVYLISKIYYYIMSVLGGA